MRANDKKHLQSPKVSPALGMDQIRPKAHTSRTTQGRTSQLREAKIKKTKKDEAAILKAKESPREVLDLKRVKANWQLESCLTKITRRSP